MTEEALQVFFDERPNIRPALDYVAGKAFITIPIDVEVPIKKKEKGEEIVVGSRRAKRLMTITSHKECFLCSVDNFMSKRLSLIGTITVPQRRWSLKSINEFLKGKCEIPSFRRCYEAILEKYQYYMDLGEQRVYKFASIWLMGSYFFPLFLSYPYAFFGGVRSSGKTKMLTVTQQMAFNSISSGNISTSALFRTIEGTRATLLIDEAEKLGATDRGQEFRNILNASYKPGNPVFRAERTSKEQFIVVDFDAYSPKMLANIAGLEDVLESRVIPFFLLRTLDTVIANREVNPNEPDWQAIRDNLYLLALHGWGIVKDVYEKYEPIEGISAREWELWRPILAIANILQLEGANIEHDLVSLALDKSKEKLSESVVEAGDSVLMKVLLSLVNYDAYYSVKAIKNRMIEAYGEQHKWLNNEWVGRSLRRQGFKEKRRIETGVEYRLTPHDIAVAAKRMGITLEGYEAEVGEAEGSEGSEDISDAELEI